MRKLASIVVALALLIAGCGWHGTGKVVNKGVDASYCTTNYYTVNGVMYPNIICYPESYWVVVQDDQTENHTVYLNLSEYNRVVVGQQLTVTE